MQRTSRELLEEKLARRWRKKQSLTIPSWWHRLAPGRGPRFWHLIEAMRRESGIKRDDTSAMGFLIDTLNRRAT
jgi:hypothetical protein